MGRLGQGQSTPRAISLPQNQLYSICEQSGMAVETRDLLIEKGLPFENIVTEIYF